MRTPSLAILVALSLLLAACESGQRGATVEWRGHLFHEVRTLADVPAAIQSGLGVDRAGLEGVADRDRPFNITDVVDNSLPMRRLLTAGRDGETWLVALERGGRGYSVEVFLFSALEGRPKQKWVLLDRPTSLREVVQQLSQKGQHEG